MLDLRWLAAVAILGQVAVLGGVLTLGGLSLLGALALLMAFLVPAPRVTPWLSAAQRRRMRGLGRLGLGFVLWAGCSLHQLDENLDRRWSTESDALRVVTGEVVDLPSAGQGRIRFRFREEGSGDLLWLTWYRHPSPMRAGECWRLRIRVRALRGLANEGGFDYERWLLRQGFAARGTVRGGESCGAGPASVDRWRDDLGRWLADGLGASTGSAVVRALVVGDRRGFDAETWKTLRSTGVGHLVAISGLHIGMLAGFAGWLAARLWRLSARLCLRCPAPYAGAIAGVAVAALYATAAGWSVSTQRAWVMVAVLALSLWGPLRPGLGTGLSIAALIVVWLDPFATLDPGFWLSFGAVGWIAWMRPLLPEAAPVRALLLLQGGLSLGLAPLTLWWFGEASLAGVLLNLWLVPLFALVVPLVLILSLTTFMWPVFSPLLFELSELLTQGMALLGAVAAQHWASTAASPSLFATVLALVGSAIVLTPIPWSLRALGGLLWLPLLFAVGRSPTAGAWIDVLDVGQGTAVVIRTAHHSMVYDTGPAYPGGFNTGDAVVVPMLQANGVRRLDRVVISHGDSDHAGGADAVLDAFPMAERWGYGGQACVGGEHWSWDGVRFEWLHPARAGPHAEGRRSGNNSSCVLRIQTRGGASALLTGDIEASVERDLLTQRGSSLRSDLLLVPHHGSASSSTRAFVKAVMPTLAIAPTGWNNRWGFPRTEVRARYADLGVPLLVTGDSGQLHIELPEQGTARLHWRYRQAQRRPWRARVGESTAR